MKLLRPMVVLDLETTGTWIEKDKIIEIAMIRCEPTGEEKEYSKKLNPGMPIPPEVVELTGISNDDVKDCQRFKDISKEILEFIEGADLAGFNVERFDLPLLTREFSDIGINFDPQEYTIFDAQKVYHMNEKRDLSAAYQFYCGKTLEGAHSALIDTRATLDVLSGQLKKYGEGEDQSIDFLSTFDYKTHGNFYDKDYRFRWWNGELYMMFGKYARRKTLKQVANDDPRYLDWILSADFSAEIKDLVSKALEGKFPEPPTSA